MRKFWMRHHRQIAMVGLLYLVVTTMAGCGMAQWLATANEIIPIATQMAVAVLTLIAALSGKTISPDVAATFNTVMTSIEAGLKDISSMVTEYQANPSPTLLGSIEQGTKSVIDNITQFLTDVHITDPATQSKVTAMLQLILTEVESFATLLPVLKAQAGQQVTITVPMSSKEAKAAFNAILSAPTGNPDVDAALSRMHHL